MKTSHKVMATALILFLLAGTTLWMFYDQLPWVGTHFVYSERDKTDYWTLDLKIQEGRELRGGQASLEDVPVPDTEAALKMRLILQGQKAGNEWLQQVQVQEIESVQYSWQQKANKELLAARWEVRNSASGGVQKLNIHPSQGSLWLRQEVSLPWLSTLWPQFRRGGVQPGQSWSASLPFQVEARELKSAVAGEWDARWSFRGLAPETAVPLAVLDLQATVRSRSTLGGDLRAEVLYSLLDKRVVAARGSFMVSLVGESKVTGVNLLDRIQGQFQLLRNIDKPKK